MEVREDETAPGFFAGTPFLQNTFRQTFICRSADSGLNFRPQCGQDTIDSSGPITAKAAWHFASSTGSLVLDAFIIARKVSLSLFHAGILSFWSLLGRVVLVL